MIQKRAFKSIFLDKGYADVLNTIGRYNTCVHCVKGEIFYAHNILKACKEGRINYIIYSLNKGVYTMTRGLGTSTHFPIIGQTAMEMY